MEKINFINDKLPALNAENLNQMQANIEKAISNPIVEDIKCKNLFNTKNLHDYNHCNYTIISNNAVIFSSNVITGRVTFDIHDLKPNTDYILSFDRTTSLESGEFLVEVYTTGANLASINSGNQVTFNSGSYTSLVIGFFNRTANDTKIEQTFSNIQLEEGTTATNYVPYKEFSNQVHYSTTKQVIGTWVDGKSVYRTIYQGDIANGTKLFSNVDAIVDIRGYGYLANTTRKVILNGLSTDASNTLFSSFFALDGSIEIYAKYGGDSTTAYNSTIILDYTETTE